MMGARLRGLSAEDYASVEAELAQMEERAAAIGNIIGPAYGAAWCDKGLKLYRSIGRLRRQVVDRYDDQQQGRW